MTGFTLRGMLTRKLRTALTAFAIVLGVATVSGTFVLTDSIDKAFDTIFTEIYQGTDATITPKSAFDVGDGSGTTEPAFDESLLARVKQLPDVADAIGGVASDSALLVKDGKAITFGGAPNLGFSVDPSKPKFNSLTLVDGTWPSAGEVVIDRSTAGKKHLEVGDEIGVEVEGPVRTMRISGLVKFGSVGSIGGATLTGFDLRTAQELFRKQGKLDQIRVAAKNGVSPDRLVAEIKPILPNGTEVRTGDAQAREDAQDTNDFISFLRYFLLAFGLIALFVGAFVIVNSLSITIAQRTRELATLRTLGASRAQVTRSVLLEGLVLGVLASVIGLFLGLALARGLFSLFDAVGFTLPNNGLLLEGRTIVVSLLLGILVTLVASVFPALRATRVPPIAAVREGATLPPGRFARVRTPVASVLTAGGFVLLVWGLFSHGTTTVLLLLIAGTLLVFIGVALLSAPAVPGLAGLLGQPARWVLCAFTVVAWPIWLLPFWLLRYGAWGPGPAGTRVLAFLGGAVLNPLLLVVTVLMAARRAVTRWRPDWPLEFPGVVPDRVTATTGTDNARRNPRRTASTASALMIGLALVTLVATLASGITKTFRGAVNDIFVGDYAVTSQNNYTPIPVSVARAAAQAPGVESVGSVRSGMTLAFGKTIFATAVTPDAKDVIALDWKQGSQAVFASLGNDGAFVDDGYADKHDLSVGSRVSMTFVTGVTRSFVVKGIFDPPTGGSPFGSVTISSAVWDAQNPQPKDLYSFFKMKGGETDANRATLEKALGAFPNAKVQTRGQFIDNQISGLNSVLNILYVLLALSVLVSFFGIINTLVLTVFERTREIGMLRAIGMTRRQVRRMVRHESVITALIGAVIGIVLGLILAGLLIAKVDFVEFAFPTAQVILFGVAAVVVGIVAAIFPARRAARLSPLDALHYE
jgi:ABC-type antimicrobial peptide transport system permease subunit